MTRGVRFPGARLSFFALTMLLSGCGGVVDHGYGGKVIVTEPEKVTSVKVESVQKSVEAAPADSASAEPKP